MALLLGAGAAIDAVDDFGFTPVFYAAKRIYVEPIKILGEANCVLHAFPDHYGMAPLGSANRSLLQEVIEIESHRHNQWRDDAPKDEAEAIVNSVITLVAQRRRMLEALVRTSLDGRLVDRLQLSPESILDHKASTAISMLREKIDLPESLIGLSPNRISVYHIRWLTLRQAHVLWHVGFRDVNELDGIGKSLLMKRQPFWLDESLDKEVEFLDWLMLRGASLHKRQDHAFQKRMPADSDSDSESDWPHTGFRKTNRASSVAALHYLAARLGEGFYYGINNAEKSQELPNKIHALADKTKQFLRTILTDPLPDCCNCACSSEGCSAYTMMVKFPIMQAAKYINYSMTNAQRIAVRMTQAIGHVCDLGDPNLAWLRCEMLRFNTFEKLRLRHTCCTMDYIGFEKEVIIEVGNDDDRREINEEQTEQLEKLEVLLVEFEKHYKDSRAPFSDLFDGFWKDRMTEISSSKDPIDQTQLESLGITLRKGRRTSSQSSEDRRKAFYKLQGRMFGEIDSDDSGDSDGSSKS